MSPNTGNVLTVAWSGLIIQHGGTTSQRINARGALTIMSKRKRVEIAQRRDLQNAGYNLTDTRTVKLHRNPQDETLAHFMAKAATAKVLAEAGYKVDSEVVLNRGKYDNNNPIADLVAYGLEDRRPIVVELETICNDEIKQKNVEKYLVPGIQDVFTLSVTAFGSDIDEMKTHAKEQLGL